MGGAVPYLKPFKDAWRIMGLGNQGYTFRETAGIITYNLL